MVSCARTNRATGTSSLKTPCAKLSSTPKKAAVNSQRHTASFKSSDDCSSLNLNDEMRLCAARTTTYIGLQLESGEIKRRGRRGSQRKDKGLQAQRTL